VTVESALWGSLIVEAVKPNSGLTKELLLGEFAGPKRLLDVGYRIGKISLVNVPSNHLESLREGVNFLLRIVRVGKQKIITGLYQQFLLKKSG
jgi:hypothetical protein